jgi:hypothetical protein
VFTITLSQKNLTWRFRMEEIRIREVHQEIETRHKNPYTGERFSTFKKGNLKGYEVIGGWFSTTFHKTLRAAEIEMASRISINEKFPFTVPRTQREIEKCERLGL